MNERPERETVWRCRGSKIIMATKEEQESYGEIVCPGCPDCKNEKVIKNDKENDS